MENFVIATNADGRVEAFYIENGVVMHIWQLEPGNKQAWSAPNALYSNKPGEEPTPLANATRVEACTGLNGQIQVVAFTADNEYMICFQTEGFWNGWFAIEAQ